MQMSDWMKVMLEEVERKQAEEAAAREEFERRHPSPEQQPATGAPVAADGSRKTGS